MSMTLDPRCWAHHAGLWLALVLGRHAAAERRLDAWLQQHPTDAQARAARAHLRAQGQRRSAAIEDLEVLVAQAPARNAADWFNLAFLLDAEGRHADAERGFRAALALNDRLDQAWYGLGLNLVQQQRGEEAIAAFKRNTELQPMSPYGWYRLAHLHRDRNEPEQTRKIIRHLQGFEPKVAAQLVRETGVAA